MSPALATRPHDMNVLAQHNKTLIAVGLTSFMVALDTTALNVALPTITEGVNGSIGAMQWVAGGYNLAFAGSLLTAGTISDRCGAYRAFIASTVFFAFSSAACAFSGSLAMLIIGRIIQGLSASLLLPSSMTLLSHAFPDRDRRARAMAVWGGISATALVIGPFLGGLLTQHVTWRSIFFLNIPVCVICGLLVFGTVCPRPQQHPSNNITGQFAFAGFLLFMMLAITGTEFTQDQYARTFLFAISLASACLFVFAERKAAFPIVPSAALRSPQFMAAVSLGWIYNFSFYGTLFIFPLALQLAGYSPELAGAALIPTTLATAFLASMSGRLANYLSPRTLAVAGFGAGALGALVLCIAGIGPVSLVLGGAAIGIAGATLPLIIGTALAHAPEGKIGVGSGIFNTARQFGGVSGIAVLGSMLSVSQADSYKYAMFFLSLPFIIASLISFRFLQQTPNEVAV